MSEAPQEDQSLSSTDAETKKWLEVEEAMRKATRAARAKEAPIVIPRTMDELKIRNIFID